MEGTDGMAAQRVEDAQAQGAADVNEAQGSGRLFTRDPCRHLAHRVIGHSEKDDAVDGRCETAPSRNEPRPVPCGPERADQAAAKVASAFDRQRRDWRSRNPNSVPWGGRVGRYEAVELAAAGCCGSSRAMISSSSLPSIVSTTLSRSTTASIFVRDLVSTALAVW